MRTDHKENNLTQTVTDQNENITSHRQTHMHADRLQRKPYTDTRTHRPQRKHNTDRHAHKHTHAHTHRPQRKHNLTQTDAHAQSHTDQNENKLTQYRHTCTQTAAKI